MSYVGLIKVIYMLNMIGVFNQVNLLWHFKTDQLFKLKFIDLYLVDQFLSFWCSESRGPHQSAIPSTY